jgi:hypothetical protein
MQAVTKADDAEVLRNKVQCNLIREEKIENT